MRSAKFYTEINGRAIYATVHEDADFNMTCTWLVVDGREIFECQPLFAEICEDGAFELAALDALEALEITFDEAA